MTGSDRLVSGALEFPVKADQCILYVAQNRQFHGTVFVDLRIVDVDVNNGAMLAELLHLAGHPVIKPDTNGQQKVGLVHRIIGIDGPVHPQPLQRERVGFGETADSHQGGGDRDLSALGEFRKLLRSIRGDHSPTAVDHRFLGGGDKTEHLVQCQLIGDTQRVIPAKGNTFWKNRLRRLVLNVLGKIHQHWARAAALGDVERLLDDARDVVDVPDQVAVLHDGESHPEEIRFLEGTAADHFLRHLSGDRD